MAETVTTAEGSSQPTVTRVSTADGEALLRAAEMLDAQAISYDDEDEPSVQKDSKETSETHASDESGDVEAKEQDKAEPSAEEKQAQEQQEQRERDEKGRFLPKSTDKPTEKPLETTDEKPKSKYADAKAREAEAWKKIEAEKASVRQQEQAIRAESQRIAQEKAEIARLTAIPRRPDGSPHEFTAKQYSKAADDSYGRAKAALAQGDIEKSNELLAQAESLSQAAEQVAQFEQQVGQKQAYEQYWNTWQQNMDVVLQQDESLRDPENPVAKEVTALLSDKDWGPILERIPNGFGVAAQLMKWKVAAVEASALSEKNRELEAEVARLTKATSVHSMPSSGMPKARTGNELTRPEQERALLEAARLADAA